MHRKALLELLDGYRVENPDEVEFVYRVSKLVVDHPNCFDRDCLPGHITASSWIVSHDHQRVLFTHHRKLDRWLRRGNPADGGRYRRASFRLVQSWVRLLVASSFADEVEASIPLQVVGRDHEVTRREV